MSGNAQDLGAFLQRAAQVCGHLALAPECVRALEAEAAAVAQPFNVAVVGRMRTGKSTLVNGLIGHELVTMGVIETTATLNWLKRGTPEQQDHFWVHWKDGRSEALLFTRMGEWVGTDAAVLERVKQTAWLDFFAPADLLRHLQVVDTPGTGSAVAAHEEIAQEVIRQTAAIVQRQAGSLDATLYVVGANGRDRDRETLEELAHGRLPESGPYNSLAILHKWETLDTQDPYAEGQRLAERLAGQLGDSMATVLLVSGALALVARTGSNTFFEQLGRALQQLSSAALDAALISEKIWSRAPTQAAVRHQDKINWSSFKYLARCAHERGTADPAELRHLALELSHIGDLEAAIEERFLRRAGIIKQAGIIQRAMPILNHAKLTLRQQMASDAEAEKLGPAIINRLADLPEHRAWVRRQLEHATERRRAAPDQAAVVDRDWDHWQRACRDLHQDLELLEAVRIEGAAIPALHRQLIQEVCRTVTDPGSPMVKPDGTPWALPDLDALLDWTSTKLAGASRQEQPRWEHLLVRLNQAAADMQAGGGPRT